MTAFGGFLSHKIILPKFLSKGAWVFLDACVTLLPHWKEKTMCIWISGAITTFLPFIVIWDFMLHCSIEMWTFSSLEKSRGNLVGDIFIIIFLSLGMFFWESCLGSWYLHVWQKTSPPEVSSQQHVGAAYQHPSLEVRNPSSRFDLLLLCISFKLFCKNS